MIYKENFEIALVSSSLVRAEFLEALKINFLSLSVDIDENLIMKTGETGVTERIAVLKLTSAIEKYGKDKCLITVDTLLKNDSVYVGKIRDEKEAFSKIMGYSNKLIEVETSFCIFIPTKEKIVKACEISFIKFRELTPDIVYHYIELGHWKNKAGGISLKNGVADILIEYINGSYSNIIGLPIGLFYDILIRENVISAM
ncbi:Maf family protein [Borrelia hermsii]|uniref:Nucleoside triphosphate pyrophosphatase n=3 Tax=Borrelia hermsii TaxID=140 RepID=A0AAN0X5Z1_BORHE|nr:Maf family protein [Borrelia hermsii]AAX16645.1 septum formation protein Maf [Borrelia hermsii DAH]AJW72952.1 septum formation protein Maf [Borrelia hermsii CC1]AMR75692.1 septum formation protein Maf [Borrelia hermsii]ANA42945.1 septum formation protein Maf [Borrelia hermsii HS1]UCP01160.1 Maf family protein [Borrelia hermsii]